jgi:ketosteroid isomerase-like protein
MSNDGLHYAQRWIAAWNSLNLERALELWADDMEFCSPLAAELTGRPTLKGKEAAAAYWKRALAASDHLYFQLEEALWDPDERAVTIVYRRERGADIRLAVEIVRLNSEGLGVRGTAFHGAVLV